MRATEFTSSWLTYEISVDCTYCINPAWLAGVDFPMLLYKQVFKNKDGSKGIIYLLCSDLECDAEALKAIYKKRWKVEVFHKTLKSNASMAKSPSHTVLTQSNHIFMSIYSAFRLELLASKLNLNHFELRSKLYLCALRSSFQELQLMKQCVT